MSYKDIVFDEEIPQGFDTPPPKGGGFLFHSLTSYLKRSIIAMNPTVKYV